MVKMAILLVIAIVLRLYGIDWDKWSGLHPDERMIVMVTEKIRFFSNLNPDFFNYGSLPIYILRLIKPLADYTELIKAGRYVSVFFDSITVIFIYKIAKHIFKNDKIAFASAFFYSIAFFPIQNSHFYVVDVLLTSLASVLLYRLLLYLKKNSFKNSIILGVVCAALLATKFTAIIFVPLVIGIVIWRNFKNRKIIFRQSLAFGLSFAAFFCLFMPYAIIERARFISDIMAQLRMNSNPYIFPYTLQYVGTIPYFYYLKNLFLWGLGPAISFLVIMAIFNSRKYFRNRDFILLSVFTLYYFIIVGRSSVKFMRYLLPIYPMLAVLAGFGLSKLKELSRYLAILVIFISIIWVTAFVNIYSLPHTRIAASEWINKNIPEGSTIAVEHWDDRLPISTSTQYNFEELTLYDQPDDDIKWQTINSKLQNSDYIIIASNRLYVPLSRLTDCGKYKVCYPKTAEYYDKLFNNKLPFRKVAEFEDYPSIKIGKFYLGINDQSADESFTVYDHPKIFIYKKI